jgi:hypothetical protein
MEDFPSVRPNAISFNSVTQMQKALGTPDAMVDMDVGQMEARFGTTDVNV